MIDDVPWYFVVSAVGSAVALLATVVAAVVLAVALPRLLRSAVREGVRDGIVAGMRVAREESGAPDVLPGGPVEATPGSGGPAWGEPRWAPEPAGASWGSAPKPEVPRRRGAEVGADRSEGWRP